MQDTAMAREEKSVYLLPTGEEVGRCENQIATQNSSGYIAASEGLARTLLSHFLAV